MASKFPITKAGPLRTTGAVQAPIRVDPSVGAGAPGAAVGQAVVAGLSIIQRIQQKRREMTDSNSIVQANALRNKADVGFETFKLNNPQETWQEFRVKQTQQVSNQVSGLDFSQEVLQSQNIRSKAYSKVSNARALGDATRQLRTDTIETQTTALVEAFATGNPQKILDQVNLFRGQGNNMGKDENEVTNDIKEAKKLGEKIFVINLNKEWEAKIAVDPEAMASILNNELELRKQGKGDLPKELSSDDISDLIGFSIAVQNRTKNLAAGLNNEAKFALYEKEDKGESLSRADFNAAYLDPDEADLRYDEYKVGQATEAKGEFNFVTKGDPIILARVEAQIDLNPLSISEPDLYKLATNGIGTNNITSLVDRLRNNLKRVSTPMTKYDTQFSTLLNAGYFGDKDQFETSKQYLEVKRKMKEFVETQKPNEKVADAFYMGLITKDFAVRGWFVGAGGGWDEKGLLVETEDLQGNKTKQRFRFGDIRTTTINNQEIEQYYAGTDEDGKPVWIPRR